MKQVVTKLKKKFAELAKRVIPYNISYKPAGYFDHTQAYIVQGNKGKVSCYEILPNQTTTLVVPKELLKILSPWSVYDVYDKVAEQFTVTTSYLTVVVPNGRLYSYNLNTVAVITADGMLLGDVSYQFHPDRSTAPSENEIFKLNFFTKPQKYSGVVFNMLAGGSSVSNYGHWVIDAVPKIYLLKESGWFDKVDWFLVPNYQLDFQKDTLKLLGIGAEKIVIGNGQLHIEADVLISSTAPRGNRSYLMPNWVVDFNRQTYLRETADLAKYPAYLYVSRRDGRARKVLNEPELIAALEKRSFRAVELSAYSFTEKVNLFYAAKVIVSVTGAGLANVMYCNPKATLVEIFPDALIHTFNYNLAKIVGLNYCYLVCKADKPVSNIKQANDANVTVDLNKLNELLDSVPKR